MTDISRERLDRALRDIGQWVDDARAIAKAQSELTDAAEAALSTLTARTIDADGAWTAIPISPDDGRSIRRIARAAAVPPLTADDRALLTDLLGPTADAVAAVRNAIGLRRFFSSEETQAKWNESRPVVVRRHRDGLRDGVALTLDRLDATVRTAPDLSLDASMTLLAGRIDRRAVALDQEWVSALRRLAAMARTAARAHAAAERDLAEFTAAVRADAVRTDLYEAPLRELKEHVAGTLNLKHLRSAGIDSVGELADRLDELESVPGLTAVNIDRLRSAVRRLERDRIAAATVRWTVDQDDADAAVMARARAVLVHAAAEAVVPADLTALAAALPTNTTTVIGVPAGRAVPPLALLRSLVDELGVASSAADAADPEALWRDYRQRHGQYHDLLADHGILLTDRRAETAPTGEDRTDDTVTVGAAGDPQVEVIDESIDPTAADAAEYERAVRAGAFDRMRVAPMLTPDSAKLSRLADVLAAAGTEPGITVVYSAFEDVLARTALVAPHGTVGPLPATLPPDVRERLLASYTADPRGRVLLTTSPGDPIPGARGAATVVMCEPMFAPTDWRRTLASATHVSVIRLLSANATDATIADFSDEGAPEADIAEQVEAIVTSERERLDAVETVPVPPPTEAAVEAETAPVPPRGPRVRPPVTRYELWGEANNWGFDIPPDEILGPR